VFHENDYCEIVREVAGDLVENVTLVCLLSCIVFLNRVSIQQGGPFEQKTRLIPD